MNALADEGIVLLGGPLAGTERGRVRVLLIVDADNEQWPTAASRRRSVGRYPGSRHPKRRTVDDPLSALDISHHPPPRSLVDRKSGSRTAPGSGKLDGLAAAV